MTCEDAEDSEREETMAKRNQEPPAHREHTAIGRRDLLRGAAAAGIATHSEPWIPSKNR